MDPDITSLVSLTEEMSQAFARDDLDRCSELLEIRGRLLKDIHGRYGPGGPLPVPEGLRRVLDEVRAQDRSLEARMVCVLTGTGRELGELQQKTRHTSGGPNGIHINRRA